MIWLGVFLVAAGAGDLMPAGHRAAGAVAVLAGVGGALLAGATDAVTLVGAAVFAAVAAWWVSRRDPTPRDAAVSMAILAAGSVAALALAALPHPSPGVLASWWTRVRPGPSGHPHVSSWLLLHLGLVLAQLGTGNRVVRRVLAVSVTQAPPGSSPLRGGRLLGPMERLIILGLGLAGQPTAASIVVAAKGLLRFPELQSSKWRPRSSQPWGIHQVTEYFLVGSFVSWSVALGALALGALG